MKESVSISLLQIPFQLRVTDALQMQMRIPRGNRKLSQCGDVDENDMFSRQKFSNV